MNARRVYSTTVDRSTGLLCDQRIVLNNSYAARDYPVQLRRIRYRDPETGKNLVFLTNGNGTSNILIVWDHGKTPGCADSSHAATPVNPRIRI